MYLTVDRETTNIVSLFPSWVHEHPSCLSHVQRLPCPAFCRTTYLAGQAALHDQFGQIIHPKSQLNMPMIDSTGFAFDLHDLYGVGIPCLDRAGVDV